VIEPLDGSVSCSAHDRKREISTQRAIEGETKCAVAIVALNGLIAADVESLFKDPRVVTILEENNFRANVIRIDSRKVTGQVIKDMSLAFFMPSGVVAGNQISDGAKKNGYTTANYLPFYTPMVIASWTPIAKIVSSNKIAKVAAESGSRAIITMLTWAKLVNVVLTKKRWHHFPNSAAMMCLGGGDHDHRCAQVKFCGDVSGAHQLCD